MLLCAESTKPRGGAFAAVCHLPPGSRQRAAGTWQQALCIWQAAPSTCHVPRATSLLAPLRPSARRQLGECLDRRLKRLLGAGRTCAAFHGRSGESEAVGNGGGGEGGAGAGAGSACKDAGRMLCPLSVMFVFPFLLLFSFSLYCASVCVCARVCVCV